MIIIHNVLDEYANTQYPIPNTQYQIKKKLPVPNKPEAQGRQYERTLPVKS